MKILVVGAGGPVGARLLPVLTASGHTVTGLTRDAALAAAIQSAVVHPIVADIFNRSAIFSALIESRPDVVIHQMTDISNRDLETNARLWSEGTRNVVDAAASVGVRRIIVQSIAWVYAPGRGSAQEGEPLDAGISRERRRIVEGVQALEQAVSQVEFSVVLRCGVLYGPGTPYAKDGWFAQDVLQGKVEATPAITSFVHVDDAAQAVALALEWPRGTANIVDDEPTPGTIWLPVYAAAIGAPPPPTGMDDSSSRGASNDKARHRLFWQPLHPTWRQGFL